MKFRICAVLVYDPVINRSTSLCECVNIYIVPLNAFVFQELDHGSFVVLSIFLLPLTSFYTALIQNVSPFFRDGLIYVLSHE